MVILSHGLWRRRFGARPDAVGQSISLNGQSYTVVGIAPTHFNNNTTDFWVPLAMDPARADRRGDFLCDSEA